MRLPLALAATLLAASCSPEAEVAAPSKTEVAKVREPLTTVASYDFEGGLSGWTAAATSGTCSWQLLTNPQTLAVSTALNPSSVTLADNGAHLAPLSGSKVIWFGHTANGTFVGNPYPAQSPKNGGTSAAVQTGTITSPVFSLAGATKAQLDFDSWWEIEGTAAAAYDLMTVLVSTNGSTFTQLAKLNPSFAAQQPADAAYSSGGPAAVPVWRHYVYDLSAYAGQSTVYVRFMFDSRDTAYNAFRAFTVDNVVIGKGTSLDAPIITSVEPNVATANDLVTINGSGFLGGAVFTIGSTTIGAANITQFGANAVIFKVPSMTAGTYPVKVTNPDGQTFTLANGFTYSSTASPTVSSISPATANINQSQGTVITGTNFVNGATVMIGGTAASSVIWNSATQLTVMVPGLAAGTYNVEVTNPSGQSGTKFAAYTVADTSTISITSPNGGQIWQAGTSQNITWTQSGGSKVNLALYKNGVFVSDIATNVTASAGTYTWAIPVTVAAGSDYRVRIYNPAGTATVTSAANFTITASPSIPTTLTLTSSANPSAVGQAVTFTATFAPSSVLGGVVFTVDGVNVGSALLVGGNTASSPAISTMTAGPHTVTATFTGTVPYANTSTSLTQIIGAAPTANAQAQTTNEDTALAVTLSATDPDNGALTYTVLSGPTMGSLSGTPPNLTYTPNANANGSDSFTFKANDGTFDSNAATVSITITPVNDAPVANAAVFTVAEDGTLNITLSGSDVDGDPLTFTASSPANGALTGTGANRVYTPNANAFGSDSFTFTVNDGTVSSSPATIGITVTPANDAPVAIASSVTTAEDTAVAVALLANDVDGDALIYTVGAPTHGSLSGIAPNLVYTPAANYFGSDAFTFTVSDGSLASAPVTVSLAITAVNDAPTANAQTLTTAEDAQLSITLSGSDVDGDALSYVVGSPAHGTLSGAAPNLTYTPNAEFHGSDAFTFSVNDGQASSTTATITLTITSVNDAPVADAANATTQEDTAVGITLTGTDVDGDALTFA
ncbi:MAG: Ig-like domain-containing protein, partial [Archangium sp.]